MLAQRLYKHFKMINSRLNTFSGIIKSLILCRGSKYKNMAEEQCGDILLDSKIKSIARFLDSNAITEAGVYNFLESYIPVGKVVLTIDRTIWELGKEIRNILILAISYDKIAMPVMFTIIPYKGSCTAEHQIELIKRFISRFGLERVEVVIGDREFDGEKFITYLASQKIAYALRVKKTNRVIDRNGSICQIRTLGDEEIRNFETKFYNIDVKLDHIKLANGEYLTIISNRCCNTDALELYRKRWDIESGFKGCKSTGFRIEDSHIIKPKRFENFIKCLFIAYAISIKTGYYENKKVPIKIKKTLGCKAYSVLQYGLKAFKQAYSISKQLFLILLNKVLAYSY